MDGCGKGDLCYHTLGFPKIQEVLLRHVMSCCAFDVVAGCELKSYKSFTTSFRTVTNANLIFEGRESRLFFQFFLRHLWGLNKNGTYTYHSPRCDVHATQPNSQVLVGHLHFLEITSLFGLLNFNRQNRQDRACRIELADSGQNFLSKNRSSYQRKNPP